MTLPPDLIARFASITGDAYALTDPVAMAPHLQEPRALYNGLSPLVLKPGSTAEVSAILSLANETRTVIVPQGGNTGLVGGQSADQTGTEVILSLSRLNRIREFDLDGNCVVVEAGVVLETLVRAVEEQGRLFPLWLASAGSCQIGGNLASNAGGTQVLAYGNTRELCLGLEVVLPDGQVLSSLSRLKKDNTGYDLRDLFIGSEGTLGVITAAVLKLFAQPKGRAVAWVAVESPEYALALLGSARAAGNLTGFELVAHIGMQFTVAYMPGSRMPLETAAPWYVLVEFSSNRSQEDASETMGSVLETALEAGTILDAAIASNKAKEDAFWALRENMSEAQKQAGGSIKHDISLPVASIPAFIEKAAAAVQAFVPGARLVTFGHLGDGNLHYNVTQPAGMDKAAYLARWDEMSHLVHGIVHEFNGSISAEHGIGRLKRAELTHYKQPLALDLMRRIKAVFDPNGILNPGKLI